MMPLMLTAGMIVFGLLLLVAAVRPARSPLSMYELRRRQKQGDPVAGSALGREELLDRLEELRQPVTSFLLVALTSLLVTGLGWMWGLGLATVAAIFFSKVSGLAFIRSRARMIYQPREEKLLHTIDNHKNLLRPFFVKRPPERHVAAFGSREELFHILTESGTILTPGEKKLLTHALNFTTQNVAGIMTERADIVTVDHNELIGPLVLSDLHKTGHSCFPVIVNDVDHIVGMLDVRDHLTLEAKRSLTAAKTMFPRAYYIRGDQSLESALAAFIRTRYHLLVVIDSEGVTTGIVSLRDVLEELFGRPMADEYASDSDLHLVAKR